MSKQFQRSTNVLDRLVSIEAFLFQIVAYLLLWVLDDYLGFVISLIIGSIALSVLLISKLVELVDRSRVPKVYYRLMLLCFLAPVIAAFLALLLLNGMSWM